MLTAFFDEIAHTELSLKRFNNQALFDDLVNHRFAPGDDYDTCHKGLSPLAFLQRTHAASYADAVDEAHYNEATLRTVADVKKTPH